MTFPKPKPDFQTDLVGAQSLCVCGDADLQLPADASWLSGSSPAACIQVSTRQHTAHSPDEALSKTLCFPAHSPAVTQLQGISQKASHFHFQWRDQFQVFGGEIRTYNFLHPSQSSLVAMAKPSLLLGYNCRSRRG